MKNLRRKFGFPKHPYHKYHFNRNIANDWNYECYRYWCLCDEGKPNPPSQRETNFFFKYGINHKKSGKSVLSYLDETQRNFVERWVAFTKSERKLILKQIPDVLDVVNKTMYYAKIQYWYDVYKSEGLI
jgi:hypothetical protein